MQETGPKKVVSSTKPTTPPHFVSQRPFFSVLTSSPNLHQLPVQKRKKQAGQRKRHFKAHNNHLAGVLEDYSDGVPVKKWNFSAAHRDRSTSVTSVNKKRLEMPEAPPSPLSKGWPHALLLLLSGSVLNEWKKPLSCKDLSLNWSFLP